jgi:pSer/pThr/pTyr-binding forkhead associated (FHA) protein
MAMLVFDYPFMDKEYPLEEGTINIGRIERNEISIPDYKIFKNLPRSTQLKYLNELTKVSRVHARITGKKEGFFIEDTGTRGLGSNYGTYVNEARLEIQKPYKLENNDAIKIGPIECTYVEEK